MVKVLMSLWIKMQINYLGAQRHCSCLAPGSSSWLRPPCQPQGCQPLPQQGGSGLRVPSALSCPAVGLAEHGTWMETTWSSPRALSGHQWVLKPTAPDNPREREDRLGLCTEGDMKRFQIKAYPKWIQRSSNLPRLRSSSRSKSRNFCWIL